VALGLDISLAFVTSGGVVSFVVALIRLGRVLEKVDQLCEDIDELRSMQDAQSARLTAHMDRHFR
jgi:hypothetical protein